MLDVLADPAAPGTGVPVIARWTLQELKDAIRAAILELDAAEAAKRARRARRERHVRVGENEDGTADLTANLPAEAADAVFTALTAGGQGGQGHRRPPHPGPVARRRTRPPRHPRRPPRRIPTR